MADNFFKYWFEGFERFIQNLDDENRISVFRECGQSCSDSYTKQIYLDEYNASIDFNDFLGRLKVKFPEVGFNIIKEGEIIELTYSFCACDLVNKEYIKSPLLCECSRQSLLYNWGSIFGKERVNVEIKQSILAGDSCCKFIIHFNKHDIRIAQSRTAENPRRFSYPFYPPANH